VWQGMNQRRFPRIKSRCDVKLQQGRGSTAISTVTENVGLGGLCVLLNRRMDLFASVELELYIDDGQSPIKTRGTVVWVVPRGALDKRKSSFDTGIEFSGLSADDRARLEALLDKIDSRPDR